MNKAIPIAVLLAVLAAGCSGSNANSDTSGGSNATPAPVLKGTTDKRTGLPVYPGAKQSSTSDSSAGTMTSYMSDDSEKSVGAWYKSTLPASYTETDNSGDSSDPTIEFDKTANGVQTSKIYLASVGTSTSISAETMK